MRPRLLSICLAGAALLSGCGASGATTATSTGLKAAHATPRRTTATAPARAAGPLRFTYHHAYVLAAPLRDPAYAALGGGRYALIGGLDAADVSTSEVDLGGARAVSQVASIGVPQHDAQAALLGSRVYVFGGGSASELSHIFSFDPRTKQIASVSNLPTASSDSSVARVGGSAYIVGGYDGTNWLNTVLAFSPSHPTPRLVARLPVGLRYAAVAASGHDLIVAGGTTATGVSDAVYRVDVNTGQVRHIATLASPVCHGEAVTIGRYVYLVGGRGDLDTSQTAAILAIDPDTGKVRSAGALPVGLSDAALIPTPRGVLVIGGLEASGAVNANVGLLEPH